MYGYRERESKYGERTDLAPSRIVYLPNGVDLLANLWKTLLEVCEGLHTLFELLEYVRNMPRQSVIDALAVTLLDR